MASSWGGSVSYSSTRNRLDSPYLVSQIRKVHPVSLRVLPCVLTNQSLKADGQRYELPAAVDPLDDDAQKRKSIRRGPHVKAN